MDLTVNIVIGIIIYYLLFIIVIIIIINMLVGSASEAARCWST